MRVKSICSGAYTFSVHSNDPVRRRTTLLRFIRSTRNMRMAIRAAEEIHLSLQVRLHSRVDVGRSFVGSFLAEVRTARFFWNVGIPALNRALLALAEKFVMMVVVMVV